MTKLTKNFIMDRITELRLKRNVSERQMSRDLGHSPTYLSNLAANKGLPSLKVIVECCNYFGISVSDFFRDDAKKEPSADYLADRVKELFDQEDLVVLVKLLNAMDQASAKAVIGILRNYANGEMKPKKTEQLLSEKDNNK